MRITPAGDNSKTYMQMPHVWRLIRYSGVVDTGKSRRLSGKIMLGL